MPPSLPLPAAMGCFILCITLLAAGCGHPVAPAADIPAPPRPSPDDATLCGPKCLHLICMYYGLPVSFDQILSLKSVSIDEKGMSLLTLRDAAAELGLSATGVRFTWEDLIQRPQASILFVHGDHFVVVPPRGGPTNGDYVFVLDGDSHAKWEKSRLLTQWKGEALIFHNADQAPSKNAPGLKLETMSRFLGVVEANSVKEVDFPFEYTGTAPARITSLKTGCGCSKIKASAEVLNSGDKGAFSVEIDLKGRRGPFKTYASIQTDNHSSPNVDLAIYALVVNRDPVDEEGLYLSRLQPGQAITRSILIRDAGDGSSRFVGVAGNLSPSGDNQSGQENEIAMALQWRPWTRKDAQPQPTDKQILKGHPGDTVLDISLNIGDTCPAGPFSGELAITTEQAGIPQEDTVSFTGCIESKTKMVPEALFFLVSAAGDSAVTRQTTLQGTTTNQLKNAAIVEPAPFLSTHIEQDTVRVECDPRKMAVSKFSGMIRCVLTNDEVINVPLQVVRSSSPGT